MGVTPYEEEMPGGYFHKTKTSVGRRLEHAMTARVSRKGYTSKEIQMTEGPMNWVSLKGHNHGEYWLLKAKHFHVEMLSRARSLRWCARSLRWCAWRVLRSRGADFLLPGRG